jgi:hypothetical protein
MNIISLLSENNNEPINSFVASDKSIGSVSGVSGENQLILFSYVNLPAEIAGMDADEAIEEIEQAELVKIFKKLNIPFITITAHEIRVYNMDWAINIP